MRIDEATMNEVVRREQILLDPAVWASPARFEAFLHPDYVEYGASGHVWDRAAIITAVSADPAVPGTAVDFTALALADDVVLLTYRITGDGGSLRSSIWIKDQNVGWRVRFHQGTRLTASQ